MTALENVSQLCQELDDRQVPYHLLVARPNALMLSVAVPGERWELEFFDDGHVETERFLSSGVQAIDDAISRLLSYFDD